MENWLDAVGAALGGAHPLSGTEAGLVLVGGLLAACLGMQVVLLRRSRRDPTAGFSELGSQLEVLQQGQTRSDQMLREELARNRGELVEQTRHLREEVGGNVRVMSEGVQKQLHDVQSSVQESTLR